MIKYWVGSRQKNLTLWWSTLQITFNGTAKMLNVVLLRAYFLFNRKAANRSSTAKKSRKSTSPIVRARFSTHFSTRQSQYWDIFLPWHGTRGCPLPPRNHLAVVISSISLHPALCCVYREFHDTGLQLLVTTISTYMSIVVTQTSPLSRITNNEDSPSIDPFWSSQKLPNLLFDCQPLPAVSGKAQMATQNRNYGKGCDGEGNDSRRQWRHRWS